MNDLTVKVDGNTLHITIKLQPPKASASGKTLVVASTHGNVNTGVEVGGKPLILGLNAYVRA